MLKLLFGRRIAKVAVQQRGKELRQTLGIAVGINHQTVVGAGREAYPAYRGLIAKLIEGDTGQVIIQREHHLTARAVHRLRVT